MTKESFIAFGVIMAFVLLYALFMLFVARSSKNEKKNYVIKKVTDNINNEVTYKVYELNYNMGLGVYHRTLKTFTNEKEAIELAKKLEKEGETKTEVVYTTEKTNQINN